VLQGSLGLSGSGNPLQFSSGTGFLSGILTQPNFFSLTPEDKQKRKKKKMMTIKK
jgi:hypothetical protein